MRTALTASLDTAPAPEILTEILEVYASDDPTKIRALTFPAGANKVETKDTAKDCGIHNFWLSWSKVDGQLKTRLNNCNIYTPDSGQGAAEEKQDGNDSKIDGGYRVSVEGCAAHTLPHCTTDSTLPRRAMRHKAP